MGTSEGDRFQRKEAVLQSFIERMSVLFVKQRGRVSKPPFRRQVLDNISWQKPNYAMHCNINLANKLLFRYKVFVSYQSIYLHNMIPDQPRRSTQSFLLLVSSDQCRIKKNPQSPRQNFTLGPLPTLIELWATRGLIKVSVPNRRTLTVENLLLFAHC